MGVQKRRLKDQPALLLLCVLLALTICVLVVGILVLSDASRSLYKSESFTSGSSSEVMDSITRGWLPEWFPQSATNIDHTHDLDTNLSLTNFAIPSVQVDTFVTSGCLEQRSAGERFFVPSSYPKMEMWNEDKIAAGIGTGKIRLYECRDGEPNFQIWILALEAVEGTNLFHAYLWNNLHLNRNLD